MVVAVAPITATVWTNAVGALAVMAWAGREFYVLNMHASAGEGAAPGAATIHQLSSM